MDFLQRLGAALRNPGRMDTGASFGRAGGTIQPGDARMPLRSSDGPVMSGNGPVNVRSFKNPVAAALQSQSPVSVSVSRDTPNSTTTKVVQVQPPMRTEDLLGGYMGGPVTMPFRPEPLDQGSPLNDDIHEVNQHLSPEPLMEYGAVQQSLAPIDRIPLSPETVASASIPEGAYAYTPRGPAQDMTGRAMTMGVAYDPDQEVPQMPLSDWRDQLQPIPNQVGPATPTAIPNYVPGSGQFVPMGSR